MAGKWVQHRMKVSGYAVRGALQRLWRAQDGNVMLVMALSILPILAAIGGAVDISRAYTEQAKLQQALDSATLAGRKVMNNGDPESARDMVFQFLKANYPDKSKSGVILPSKRGILMTSTQDGSLKVEVTAQAKTYLMRLFGKPTIEIAAKSEVKRGGINIDVVIVADTTGSMTKSMGNMSRARALEIAATSFVDILEDLQNQLKNEGLRVRVGVVPYSQVANMGRLLYAENPDYIQTTNIPYQSMMPMACIGSATNNYCRTFNAANEGKWLYWGGTRGSWNGTRFENEHGPSTLDLTRWVQRGVTANAATRNSDPYAWSGCLMERPTVQSIDARSNVTVIPQGAWDIIDAAPGVNGAPRWAPYFYMPLRDGERIGPPTLARTGDPDLVNNLAPFIPEADPTTFLGTKANLGQGVPYELNIPYAAGPGTVSTISSTMTPSLRTEILPTTNFTSSTTRGFNALCATEALPMQSYFLNGQKSVVTNYFKNLYYNGNTHHEVGMYWGMVMLSPEAPLPNPTMFNNRAVKRYMLFLTDGELAPVGAYMSSRGIDSRPTSIGNHVVGRGNGSMTDALRMRFRMLCEYAKRSGMVINTVGISEDVTAVDRESLRKCASSDDDYYITTKPAELNESFKRIARNIGYLRIEN